ncbi:hypothetical protein HanRHA438_Chr08g0327711 [Helianthus annuus]|nr:hypothetical protein HanRHA438_Chr08g0327711 [Helianthus annuus]
MLLLLRLLLLRFTVPPVVKMAALTKLLYFFRSIVCHKWVCFFRGRVWGRGSGLNRWGRLISVRDHIAILNRPRV